MISKFLDNYYYKSASKYIGEYGNYDRGSSEKDFSKCNMDVYGNAGNKYNEVLKFYQNNTFSANESKLNFTKENNSDYYVSEVNITYSGYPYSCKLLIDNVESQTGLTKSNNKFKIELSVSDADKTIKLECSQNDSVYYVSEAYYKHKTT